MSIWQQWRRLGSGLPGNRGAASHGCYRSLSVPLPLFAAWSRPKLRVYAPWLCSGSSAFLSKCSGIIPARLRVWHFAEVNERILGVSRVLESAPPRYGFSERDGRRGALGRRPPQRRGGGFVRKERLGRFGGRQLRKEPDEVKVSPSATSMLDSGCASRSGCAALFDNRSGGSSASFSPTRF